MIISAVQSMQITVVGQTKSRAEARARKVDGYKYAYVLGGVTTADMSNDDACKVIDSIMFDVMHAGEIKDLEINRDASCPLFSFRFFSHRCLAESYTVELCWIDEDTETDEKGNPIITKDTPIYGKDELPADLENLIPICDEIEIS